MGCGMNLPLPPIELMRSVGPTDPAWYDNPDHRGALDHYGVELNDTRVLDFGCGCGRLARQLMLQRHPPADYLGLDLNRAAIDWCGQNLASHAFGFHFRHLDIFNAQFNP